MFKKLKNVIVETIKLYKLDKTYNIVVLIFLFCILTVLALMCYFTKDIVNIACACIDQTNTSFSKVPCTLEAAQASNVAACIDQTNLEDTINNKSSINDLNHSEQNNSDNSDQAGGNVWVIFTTFANIAIPLALLTLTAYRLFTYSQKPGLSGDCNDSLTFDLKPLYKLFTNNTQKHTHTHIHTHFEKTVITTNNDIESNKTIPVNTYQTNNHAQAGTPSANSETLSSYNNNDVSSLSYENCASGAVTEKNNFCGFKNLFNKFFEGYDNFTDFFNNFFSARVVTTKNNIHNFILDNINFVSLVIQFCIIFLSLYIFYKILMIALKKV
jgi:hypothetical protein